MKLSAASMTLFGSAQNTSTGEANVAAAASLARAGDPLLASRAPQREGRLNPSKPAESNLTFGYGEH